MEMKLLRLTLENFKGCCHLSLDFAGRGAAIYGENGSGKSTVYDGFTWLLFGKDSRGQSNFDIKPLDGAGQVVDHGAVTSAEAVLSVDGAALQLKRTYYERWSTRRGSAEAPYEGNTSEYFIDGVPMKKGEYESRIGELVSEDLFRVLTNVTWFCGGLDWRKRRDLLFRICELPDDSAIMAVDSRFTELAAAMGETSVDDYKRKLQARRKGLSADRNTIPARLDEQKKTVAELAVIDFPALRTRRDGAAARLEELRSELLKLGHGALLESKRNELAAARNAVEAEVNSNAAHRQRQIAPVEDRRPALRAAIDAASGEYDRWQRMTAGEEAAIAELEGKVQAYRDAWAVENTRAFTGGSCPTCGQALPEIARNAAVSRFAEDKKRALQSIVDRVNDAKASLASAQERRREYIQAAETAETKTEQLRAELAAYRPEEPPTITDLPGHAERLAEADEKVRTLAAEVQALEADTAAIRREISDKTAALQGEVRELDSQLAKESLLAYARQREAGLREDAKRTAAELSEVDRLLDLCEEFARHKVRYVESSVNSRFRRVRWKLYDEQVNGGLADCCEATFSGVPYASVNNGMRINMGLDVIRTLSEYYGLRVPLIVDNAESVTELGDAGTQIIRLVVSEQDKELRIVYED